METLAVSPLPAGDPQSQARPSELYFWKQALPTPEGWLLEKTAGRATSGLPLGSGLPGTLAWAILGGY